MSELASFSMWQWAFVVFLVLANLILPFVSAEPFKGKVSPTRSHYAFISIMFGIAAVYFFLDAFSARADNGYREMVNLLGLTLTVSAAIRCNELRKVTK